MTEGKKEGLCALQRVLLMVLAVFHGLRMLTGCVFELAGKDRERDRMEKSASVYRQAWTEGQITLFETTMALLGTAARVLVPVWLYRL